MGKFGLASSACVFITLLLCARFETNVFTLHVDAVLSSGPWMAVLIFAHNSLAATVVTTGMLFLVNFMDTLPERFKRRDSPLLRRPRLFSAAFSALLVVGSALSYGGLNALNASSVFMLLPVAAVEAYGLYLASLAGLRRCVLARNMAKVYAVFAFGATLETFLILCLSG